MSFREKSAWICIVTTIAVYLPYFSWVFSLLSRGALHPALMILGAFIAAVIVQIVMQIVAHVAIVIQTRQEPMDERDHVIDARSIRISYYVLLSLCVMIAITVLTLAAFNESTLLTLWLNPAFLSQVVLLCLVLAELIRFVALVVYYRLGS